MIRYCTYYVANKRSLTQTNNEGISDDSCDQGKLQDEKKNLDTPKLEECLKTDRYNKVIHHK